jgi:hypothetical protein
MDEGHPQYLRVSGYFTPPPPSETDTALEPRPEAEGQLELLQGVGTYEVEIDYAGTWTIRPVEPLTPQPAPWTEPQPEADGQAEPQPKEPIYEEPAPEPEVEPEPPPRPDDLRCVPPPGPRRARGGPPPLGPRSAARGMDPLAPEFTHTLVRKAMQAIAGMDRVTRPGGIATDEGLSAAVRSGMQHLAAHKGDVRAALAAAKAAGEAGHAVEPTPHGETSNPGLMDEPVAEFMRPHVRPTGAANAVFLAPAATDPKSLLELIASGNLKRQGFGGGCQNGGSFGTTGAYRVSGRILCASCAEKALGFTDLPGPERAEALSPFSLSPD